jgi:hypothetical protein
MAYHQLLIAALEPIRGFRQSLEVRAEMEDEMTSLDKGKRGEQVECRARWNDCGVD